MRSATKRADEIRAGDVVDGKAVEHVVWDGPTIEVWFAPTNGWRTLGSTGRYRADDMVNLGGAGQ